MTFPTFEEYRDTWLDDVVSGTPSTVELGLRFAEKLVTQWLEYDGIDTDDFIFCDGAGDGGIDAAILNRRDENQSSEYDTASGDTWYLVQSKYGSSYSSGKTILEEGIKIISTLTGKSERLCNMSKGLVEKIRHFRNRAIENDRIVLVFSTVDPIEEKDRNDIDQIRILGRNQLGSLFDVECISIRTIYERLLEETALAHQQGVHVELDGNLVAAGDELLIGSISLIQFYDFLKKYRNKTGDLDRIFEKNVRKFLGGRVKVNKGMKKTLEDNPERFGLFNNGITIVVSDFSTKDEKSFELIEPYIVNGCQTSRSVWEVCDIKLGGGGRGSSSEIELWKKQAESGCVVTKIAKVGSDGENLLNSITRYTNSQNTIRDKDFVSLDNSFRTWCKEIGDRYNLFLEIQRGGWESQKALQKRNPNQKRYDGFANATELMKIYSAGWLDLPGLAYRSNGPFIPGGQVFQRVVNCKDETYLDSFGAKDIYAAYLLQEVAKRNNFGKKGNPSRGRTKFLFIFVLVTLLREVARMENKPYLNSNISTYVVRLFSGDSESQVELERISVEFIDDYFRVGNEYGVHKEPRLGNDMFYFIKSEFLGKNLEETPHLRDSLGSEKRNMGRGQPSARAIIAQGLLGNET
jgi:AIPR protein